MTKQSVKVGSTEVFISPTEAEDGSFVASARGKSPDQTFGPQDWADPRVRTDAARIICEDQNMSKVAKAIDTAMG